MEDIEIEHYEEEKKDLSNEEKESSESSIKKNNIFRLNVESEEKYWGQYILKTFIYLQKESPQCKIKQIKLGNRNNLNNPNRMVCNNYKCSYV